MTSDSDSPAEVEQQHGQNRWHPWTDKELLLRKELETQ